MIKIENTVSAVNLMINSSELSFIGNENAPLKILIVGNSITRHGPNKSIGWERDWGMAASAPDKDNVHRLYAKLQENGIDAFMRITQAAHWERNFQDKDILARYDDDRNFHADIVIFRLGENVLSEEYPLFKEHFIRYIEHICPEGSTCLFTTCFWKSELVEIIKEYAGVRGDICVELGYEDEKEMALGLYEHRGVSLHPSDYGMEMMASKILKGVQAVLSRK